MKKQLINEVDQFKKIAGLLKETWHPDDPSGPGMNDGDEDEEDLDDMDDISENDDYDESSDSESDDTDAMGGINEAGSETYEMQQLQNGMRIIKNMAMNTKSNASIPNLDKKGIIQGLKELEDIFKYLSGEGDIQEDTYSQTYEENGTENPQPEDEQFSESMYDLYRNPGDLNSAIEHYADGELDMDNDTMPTDYSVPNPGLYKGKKPAWKPKPFNNGKADYSEPHKYGW